MVRITEEAALALVKAFYPRRTSGKWYIADNGDSYWEVAYGRHERDRLDGVFVGPAGTIEKADGTVLQPPKVDGKSYTFEIQSEARGSERVLLCIDDAPWNEFTGPIAKGVIALIQGRK